VKAHPGISVITTAATSLSGQLGQLADASPLRDAIAATYSIPETAAVERLLAQAKGLSRQAGLTRELACRLADAVRNRRTAFRTDFAQGLLQEFSLSEKEGIALMCLAEALLRIPDKQTRDALIRDKVASGDWLQLTGALVWGCHVLLVGLFASRYDAIRLAFLQFVTCSVVSMALALVFEEIHWGAIVQAGPALLYGGLLGVGTGFTLQVIAQKHAIASHAAIILSLEAVFAAIAGAIFLDESLHARGYFGCALMLAGMLVAQLWPQKQAAAA